MMIRRRRLAVAVCLAMAGGCSTHQTPAGPIATLQTQQPEAPSPYALQIGDQIGVKFYNNPELNEEVTIRPDGMISLQLIGDVQAAGLAPATLGAALTERYVGELATPRISVIVRLVAGNQVYVGGEVSKPGVVPFTSGLSLYQAIQAAGGVLKTAQRSNVVLIRRDADGRASGHLVDVRPIASGEQPETDIPLRQADIVVVPTSKIADVNTFVEQYIKNNLPIPIVIPTF